MKVIFLDISGTLTNRGFDAAQWEALAERRALTTEGHPVPPRDEVDRLAVARVNRIVEATGARIVISSDWVKFQPEESYPSVQAMLRAHGLVAEFAGHTVQPRANTVIERGLEIRAWLDEHPEVEGYVILDDAAIPITEENRNYLMECGHGAAFPEPDPELGAHFICLDDFQGLRDEHVERAVEILGSGMHLTVPFLWWKYSMLPSTASGTVSEAVQTEFDVVISSFSQENRLAVLAAVRKITPLRLLEAKNLVGSLPAVVLTYVPQDVAVRAREVLEAAGATVEVR